MFGMMTQASHDAFRFWQRAAETATASAFVIDRRSRMMAPGRVPSPAYAAEMAQLVPEKLAAFGLANLAMMTAWCGGTGATWAACDAALAPFHARATANAKRLKRH